MQYKLIQIDPYPNAVFAMRGQDGRELGTARRTLRKKDGFRGFQLDFLGRQIQIKFTRRFGVPLQAFKFWEPLRQYPCRLFRDGEQWGELWKDSSGIYLMQLEDQPYYALTVGLGSAGLNFPVYPGTFLRSRPAEKQIARIETPNLAQKLNHYQITAQEEPSALLAAVYGVYIDCVSLSISGAYYRKTYLKSYGAGKS